MENRSFEKWSELVHAADPDIILAVEIDDVWMERAVARLSRTGGTWSRSLATTTTAWCRRAGWSR